MDNLPLIGKGWSNPIMNRLYQDLVRRSEQSRYNQYPQRVGGFNEEQFMLEQLLKKNRELYLRQFVNPQMPQQNQQVPGVMPWMLNNTVRG